MNEGNDTPFIDEALAARKAAAGVFEKHGQLSGIQTAVHRRGNPFLKLGAIH